MARTPEREGFLTRGTIIAACLAACVGQIGFATPAVLNGLFQQDLGTTASQLNWISAAIVIPLTLFELTFGDMVGRKRLLVGGALLMLIGELIAALLTPSASTHNAVVVVWIGIALAGIGGAALFPTSLAMIAAKTRTAKQRGKMIPIYAAALSSGGFLAPVLAGLLTKLSGAATRKPAGAGHCSPSLRPRCSVPSSRSSRPPIPDRVRVARWTGPARSRSRSVCSR